MDEECDVCVTNVNRGDDTLESRKRQCPDNNDNRTDMLPPLCKQSARTTTNSTSLVAADETRSTTSTMSSALVSTQTSDMKFTLRNKELQEQLKQLKYMKDTSMLALGTGIPLYLSTNAQRSNQYWMHMHLKNCSGLGAGMQWDNGKVRVRKTMIDFYNAVEQWQSYQIDVWRMIFAANLHFVLDTERDKYMQEVMSEYKIEKLPTEVMIMAYRGSGKSCIIGAAVAALFRNTPNYYATLYAVTLPKSMELLDEVKTKLVVMDMARKTDCQWKRSGQTIKMVVSPTDMRMLVALTTKGMVRPTRHYTINYITHTPDLQWHRVVQIDRYVEIDKIL